MMQTAATFHVKTGLFGEQLTLVLLPFTAEVPVKYSIILVT